MVSKKLCVLVLWTKVASALEGLKQGVSIGWIRVIWNILLFRPLFVEEGGIPISFLLVSIQVY